MIIVVKLAIPSPKLSPNARTHFHAKARLVKKYRSDAKVAFWSLTSTAFKPRYSRARVRITWYAKRLLFPDRDNALASLKAGFDGLTDAGLFSDDRGLSYEPIVFRWDAKKPRVELEIEPM